MFQIVQERIMASITKHKLHTNIITDKKTFFGGSFISYSNRNVIKRKMCILMHKTV